MLNLEDILDRTAKGVLAREQEVKRSLERELEKETFKALWETVKHHIEAAADNGQYSVSIPQHLLGDHPHLTYNKLSLALSASGFQPERLRDYFVVTWAEPSLSIDRREILYRVKYGSFFK